jgi:hypothetical protein
MAAQMTTSPFKCAKTGQEFLPHEGGHCGLCRRLLLTQFLHSKIFPRQVAPACSDCLADLREVASKDKWPSAWLADREPPR